MNATALISRIIVELGAMLSVGMINLKEHDKAIAYISAHPGEFTPGTGLSTSELAEFAIECAKVS